MNGLTGMIILAVFGFISHMGLLSFMCGGLSGPLSNDKGRIGSDDEEEDAGSDEDQFVNDLFGGGESETTDTAIMTDDDEEEDDNEVFDGSGGSEAIDFGSKADTDGEEHEGEEDLSQGSQEEEEGDNETDEEGQPGEEGESKLEDVDFDKLKEDDIIDMIADNKFTSREKGFLKQMHADRRKRQEAQATTDSLRLAMKAQAMKKDDGDEEDDDDGDPIDKLFDGKEDDEFMSVADVKKVMAKQQEQESKQIAKAQKKLNADRQRHESQMKDFQVIEDQMKTTHGDYEDMLKVAAVAMNEEPLFARKMNVIKANGGNPVEFCYKLGKKYAPLYLEAINKGSQNKEDENNADGKGKKPAAKNNASRMQKNARKKKTSASLGSGRSNPSKGVDLEALDAMETDELVLTLHKMSPKQLVSVPRRVRDRALGG